MALVGQYTNVSLAVDAKQSVLRPWPNSNWIERAFLVFGARGGVQRRPRRTFASLIAAVRWNFEIALTHHLIFLVELQRDAGTVRGRGTAWNCTWAWNGF